MQFHWEKSDDKWCLMPVTGETRIVVGQKDSFWSIFVNGRPLLPGNYSNEEGAKRDAWQFALQTRKSHFGAYHIELVE